jgi:hypothetical protein
MRCVAVAVVCGVLAGCVSTSVTPISQNQFILNASAAPVCGNTGAAEVASRMAAVETLRRGYDRYVIQGAQSQSNVGIINRPPTGAFTTGNFSGYGNTVYGSSQTVFTGGGPMVVGTHDTGLAVLMLRPGEQGYNNALDARTVLGTDWQELVEKGIRIC